MRISPNTFLFANVPISLFAAAILKLEFTLEPSLS